jgi:hypothetical protein
MFQVLSKCNCDFIDKLKYILKHKVSVFHNKKLLYSPKNIEKIVHYQTVNVIGDENVLILIIIYCITELKNNKIIYEKHYNYRAYLNSICVALYHGIYFDENDMLPDNFDWKVKDIWKIIKSEKVKKNIISSYFNTRPIIHSVYYEILLFLSIPEDIIIIILEFV